MPKPKGAKTKKANPNKPGPKFTLTDRERVKFAIAQYDIKGFSQTDIAKMPDVNVSQATVSNILREIQQDYQDAYIDNRKMWVMREHAVLMDLRRRANVEIERLKAEGKKKSVRKSGTSDKGGFDAEENTVEDPELLGWHRLVLDTVRESAELLGLKELAAQVFNLNVNSNTVNMFDRFMLEMLNGSQGTLPGVTDQAQGSAVDDAPGVGAGG